MKSNLEPSTQEVLAGLVERVTFHNAENGFCVLRAKARGHRDLVPWAWIDEEKALPWVESAAVCSWQTARGRRSAWR